MAIIFQFQFCRLKQITVAARPSQHCRKRLNLPGKIVDIHRLWDIQRRIDALARVIGRCQSQRFLTDKSSCLAGKCQRYRHVIFPGALRWGKRLIMARRVVKYLFNRQA